MICKSGTMSIPILSDSIDGDPELRPNVPEKVDYNFEYIEFVDSLKGFFTGRFTFFPGRNTRRR